MKTKTLKAKVAEIVTSARATTFNTVMDAIAAEDPNGNAIQTTKLFQDAWAAADPPHGMLRAQAGVEHLLEGFYSYVPGLEVVPVFEVISGLRGVTNRLARTEPEETAEIEQLSNAARVLAEVLAACHEGSEVIRKPLKIRIRNSEHPVIGTRKRKPARRTGGVVSLVRPPAA